MIDDPFVEAVVALRIDVELGAIEHQHGVQILLAIESGSRAWRFPSRDSDYDVRFLYVRPVENYLTVAPRRDVIEQPIDATLDVNGWDVRKALQLLIRSNAVLIEWLTSPVRYREVGTAPARLLELARSSASLTALSYHYDRQARHGFDSIVTVGDAVRTKTYCYALRAALALTWIRYRSEVPPMDLPSLMAGVTLPTGAVDAIANLLARKRQATERDTTPRIAPLDALIGEALEQPVRRGDAVPRHSVVSRADALFASIVLHSSLAVGRRAR